MKEMKALVCAAGIVAALLPLIGCMGVNTPNIPSFVTSDNLIRIEVTNDQVGQKGLASKAGDNFNELLKMLHLGDITASSRIDVPEPTASAYSLVAYDTTQFVWTIRVLDSPESSRV